MVRGQGESEPECRTSLLVSAPMEHPNRFRRLLILGVCCLSLLMVGLDTTIVNVALPSIHRALHASVSGLQWVLE